MPHFRHIAAIAAVLVACSSEARIHPAIEDLTPLDAPAGPRSGEPNLAVDANGRVHLSWLERDGDSTVALRLAMRDNGAWSTPVTVTSRSDLFVNWADFPSVFVAPSGRLVMHWLQKRPGGKYSYDVIVRQSNDGGASWSEPRILHDDNVSAEHGFTSFFAAEGDSVEAVWLDGRATAGGGHDGHDAARGAMQLGNGRIAADGGVSPSAMIEPTRVHSDDWHIEGCPVNGPSVVADGNNVAVAWFTGARDTARVNVAFSTDAGATFSAPVRVDDGNPAGRVDVEFDGLGRALVTWLERVGEQGAEVRIKAVSAAGEATPHMVIASSSAARTSGFPRMVRSGDQLVLAWTIPGDTARVMMATARVATGKR
jgi:hypothetical protein